MKCRHCGRIIKHFDGRLWHDVDQPFPFPQYCRTGTVPVGSSEEQIHADGGLLHAPKENEITGAELRRKYQKRLFKYRLIGRTVVTERRVRKYLPRNILVWFWLPS